MNLFFLFSMTGCRSPETTSLKASEQPWQDPSQWGYFDAGLETIEWTDARGKELEADIWYPAYADASDELASYEPTALSIGAYRRAVPAVRSAPVVAFSHGFFAIRFQSAFLMEHLARHGFVVIAPDHPQNTFMDFDDDATVDVLLERPDDIRASVDELQRRSMDEDDFLYSLADASEYSVIGHSFGSHTAMVLGGGELNYEGLLSYCAQFPDARPCDYLTNVDLNEVANHGGSDERVVTSIPMSPGLWYTFGTQGEGLARLENTLVLAGELDGVLEYAEEALPAYSAMGSPKMLASVPGAGHYGFSDICLLAEALTPECGSMDAPEFTAIEEIKQLSQTVIMAHLGQRVLGDERYAPWLEQVNWPEDLLVLTSE